MEFLDNSGHIFSLTSYNQKPIGYEYDENPYVFYMNDDKQYRLSINNYYIRTIYALYQISSDIDLDKFEIDIYFNNTNIYKLISPIKFQEKVSNLKDLSDSVEFDLDDDEIIKTSLSKDDLYCIETTDTINNIDYNYYLIPIYVLSYSDEEGTWLSNLMIHINDNEYHTYCPITIGAVYVNEYEELIINGKNMGVSLPKDIIKAIYSESIYNSEFNLELYNKKLKEYLINYTSIKHELGNYNSVINSLKWFGYGNKIILSKLIKTDNDIMNQYIRDYFNIEDDILKSFSKFKNDSLISLIMMTNKELEETNDIDNSTGWLMGENKPKLYSLLDNYELIKINNHDLPIENDKDKYFYWKPYFDFSFNELCIKLSLLKYFFKKYFLPIHLNVHTASLGERVFMNDMKMTAYSNFGMTSPIVCIHKEDNEVTFTGNGIHYYTKQIHYVDDYFNEFDNTYMEHNYNEMFYELNDTCISIPINFKNDRLYNCILILERYNETLFESHFSFYNTNNSYRNFIIYPKKLNIKNYIESKAFEYWINSEFNIKLCVNNKWYEYHFKTKLSKPVVDFGKLKYKYKFNNVKDLLGYNPINDNIQHALIFVSKNDNKCYFNDDSNILENHSYLKIVDPLVNESKTNYTEEELNILKNRLSNYLFDDEKNNYRGLLELLYDNFNLDDNKSAIIPLNSNIEIYNTIIDYGNYSKFSQINNITSNKINFNAYMHNHKMVELNNINFDVEFYKILKYHLDNNLQYIDGTLINNQFYTYFNYWETIKNNDTRIKLFFEDAKNKLFGFEVYKLTDSKYYKKLIVKPSNYNGYDLYDEYNVFYKKWEDNETYYIKYEVYIHKDLIGKPISIRNTYLSNLSSNLLYASDSNIYILRETDTNSDIYEIINEDYRILGKEYDESFGIILESFELEYNAKNNTYYKITYNDQNEEIVETYELYDKIFKNKDEYYDNYQYTTNIIRSEKYLNVIHLFGIYSRNYKLNNVISFNTNADINVNGVNFKFINKYLDKYTNEELSLIEENNVSSTTVYSDKFYVSGHILNSNIEGDTRYPDVYGLYWEHYLTDENGNPYLQYKEDTEEYQNFGLYVKRNYNENKNINEWLELDNTYYSNDESIEYNSNLPGAITVNDFKIPMTDTNPGIKYSEEEVIEYNNNLPNAVKPYNVNTPKETGVNIEYITYDEYWYYVEQNLTELGSFRFDTLNNFNNGDYNKEYIPKNFYGELNYVKINNEHIYQWVDTKLYDITNDMQPYKYNLIYKIYVKQANNNGLIPITPSIIYSENYEYLIVKFSYHKVCLVKNKYYSLEDYLTKKLGAEKVNNKYVINNHEVNILYSYDDNNDDYNMTLPNSYNTNNPIYYTQEECDEYNIEHNLSEEDEGFLTIKDIKEYKVIITKKYNVDDAPSLALIGEEYTETYFLSKEEIYEHNLTLDNSHKYINGHENRWVMIYYDNNDNQKIIDIMKVNNIKRYLDIYNQEIKIQNPSGYWVNVDNGKIQNVNSSLNELKRYWFNENEDTTKGDTIEEIRDSLEIYKQKLEKLKTYNNNNEPIILPEYGLNQDDSVELRYKYRNYLSKYITGLKGKFKIEWSYVDANGNIDISDTLDESVKIFNLCVCVTNKDDSVSIYNENGEVFELSGNEKEAVVYFRLNTIDNHGYITPFYIKPKLISVTETNERLKYNYKECGEEIKINIGNKTYLYGDNSSEYVINLYNMFFENTYNLYDVYPVDTNNNNHYYLIPHLIHKIYDINENIKIEKNNLYDFYLMHDNEYWYGLYISKDTCDNIDLYNIKIDNSDKVKYLNNIIMMKYERSSKEFLLNRMKYVSSNGVNHFMNDDIICAYMTNNDKLPIKTDITSKWRISPMSLGMDKTSDFESNAEMTIISMPYNDNKYQSGYYKVTVRYSLDRDLQHQFKDSATFMVI